MIHIFSVLLGQIINSIASFGTVDWLELNHDETLDAYPRRRFMGYRLFKNRNDETIQQRTTLDLKNYPLHKAKKLLTITGIKTVQELNGILNGIRALDRIEAAPDK